MDIKSPYFILYEIMSDVNIFCIFFTKKVKEICVFFYLFPIFATISSYYHHSAYYICTRRQWHPSISRTLPCHI